MPNTKRVNINEVGALLADTINIYCNTQNNVVPHILGYVNKQPVLLLLPRQRQGGPSILIAAGFHGNEIAGSLAIIKHLASNVRQDNINISYLPAVSLSALKRGTHLNEWNENSNRGFCNTQEHSLSKEGAILFNNIDMLHNLSKDGYLALHEDSGEHSFYAYTLGAQKKRLSTALKRTGRKFFALKKRNTKDGIILDDYANSFEDVMLARKVPYIATTETPVHKSLKLRIQANVALIKTFCNIVKSAK